MYIEASTHNNKESLSPQVHASIHLKCANSTKITSNITKSSHGSQHNFPLYDSGYSQAQNQEGKEKKNIKYSIPKRSYARPPDTIIGLYYSWMVGVTPTVEMHSSGLVHRMRLPPL